MVSQKVHKREFVILSESEESRSFSNLSDPSLRLG